MAEAQRHFQDLKPKEVERFELPNSSLVGKTRDQLTPEEREAEELFQQKQLDKFATLLVAEKLHLHCVTSETFGDVLSEGILPYGALEEKYGEGKAPFGMGGTEYQDRANFNTQWLQSIVFPEKRGMLSEGELKLRREYVDSLAAQDPIEGAEAIKESRRIDYFNRNIQGKIARAFFKKDHLTNKERQQALHAFKAFEGRNLISSYPPEEVFREVIGKEHALMATNGSIGVFFDTPPRVRSANLPYPDVDEKANRVWDVGVANKVSPNHFRAISYGFYDQSTRQWDVSRKSYAQDVAAQLKSMQKRGAVILDSSMQTLPPLDTLAISQNSFRPCGGAVSFFVDIANEDDRKRFSKELNSLTEEDQAAHPFSLLSNQLYDTRQRMMGKLKKLLLQKNPDLVKYGKKQ